MSSRNRSGQRQRDVEQGQYPAMRYGDSEHVVLSLTLVGESPCVDSVENMERAYVVSETRFLTDIVINMVNVVFAPDKERPSEMADGKDLSQRLNSFA